MILFKSLPFDWERPCCLYLLAESTEMGSGRRKLCHRLKESVELELFPANTRPLTEFPPFSFPPSLKGMEKKRARAMSGFDKRNELNFFSESETPWVTFVNICQAEKINTFSVPQRTASPQISRGTEG